MIPSKTKILFFLMVQFWPTSAIFFLPPQEQPVPIRNSYDFIIIGSGSSGSVLANRLSSMPEWNVLLLEAGKRTSIVNDIPVVAPALQFTDYNWGYKMERSSTVCLGLEDQRCPWPRGKGLGGSSLINYMIYTRGNKIDFDEWESQGNPGWSYNDVLPYFKKSERSTLRLRDEDYHGKSGLLSVEDVSYRSIILESFIQGGQELGYPFVDYNGRTQEGFSYVQANTKNGRRHSGYRAFIEPIQSRSNLHILINTRVTRILINPDSKVAYGVEFVKDRKYHTIKCKKEVILSAGALNSPQILMLSGIGPKMHLKSLGIKVLEDLPVGQNLHDHITFLGAVFELNATVASDQKDAENPVSFLNWLLHGKGTLTSLGGVEGLGYFHTNVSTDIKAPDMEFIFLSGSMSTDNGLIYRKSFGVTDEVYDTLWKPLEGKHTWSIFPMLLHPKSTGHLELKSKNPYDWPKFYGNYLSDPENLDVQAFIKGIREIIKLSQTYAFQKYGSKLNKIKVPGCEKHNFDTDEYWECALRHISTTLHHQAGTCKMGPKDDATAVVDHECRVHGIKNLRVVDTSIIPFALSAHTSAPAFMLGEKASDMIKYSWNS